MAFPAQQIPQIPDDEYNRFLDEVEKELQISQNNLTVQRQRMLSARLNRLEESEAQRPNPIRDDAVFKDQATQTGAAGQAARIGSLATQQIGGSIVSLANRAFEAVGLAEEGSTDTFNEYQADLNRWFNKKSIEDETDLLSPGWEQAATGATRSLGEMAIGGFIGKAALGTKSLMTGVWENATNPAFLGAIGFAGANRGNQALTEAEAAGLFDRNRHEWSTPYIYAAVASANEMGIAAAFQRFGMGGLEARMFGKKTLWDGIGSAAKKLGIDLTHEMTEEVLTEVLDYSWSVMNDVEDYSPEGLFNVIEQTARQVFLSMGAVGSVQETSNYLNDPRRILSQEIEQGSKDFTDGMIRFESGSGGVHSRARYAPLAEVQAHDQFTQEQGIITDNAGEQRKEKKHFWKKNEMLRPGGALAFATTYPDKADRIANTKKPSRKMWNKIVPGMDAKEWKAEEREVFAEQLRAVVDHPGFDFIKQEHSKVTSQQEKREQVQEGMRSGDPERIIAELRKQKEETGVTPKIEDVLRDFPVGSREDADRILRHGFGHDYKEQREYDIHLRDINNRDYSKLDKLPWHQLRKIADPLGIKSRGSKSDFIKRIEDALRKRFEDSKAVDDSGKPLRVYRGEHGKIKADSGRSAPPADPTNASASREEIGQRGIQTRHGSISFSPNPDTASTYALHPNNSKETAINPRVIPAYLNVKNPVINTPDDPYFDLSVARKILGEEKAKAIALDLDDYIQNTDNWQENFSDYLTVEDLLNENPGAIDDLYLRAHPVFDSKKYTQWFKDAGYDGAIHGGFGDNALEAEYKVFDEEQVIPAFNPDKSRIQYSMGSGNRYEEIVDLKQADKPQEEAVYPGRPSVAVNTGDTPESSMNVDPVSADAIIERIKKDFKLPIRLGRITNRRAAGIYKPWLETIRLKRGYERDLSVAIHEMGHHIDKKYSVIRGPGSLNELAQSDSAMRATLHEISQLDYDQNAKRDFEGFAEYMAWLMLTDSAPQHAPLFTQYFMGILESNPELAEKLNNLRKLSTQFRLQGSLDRAQFSKDGKPVRPAGETWKEWFSDKIGNYVNIGYQDWVDRGSILDEFDKDIKEISKTSSASNPFTRPGYTAAAMFNALSKTGPKNAYYAATDGVFSLIDPTKKIGNGLNRLSEIDHLEYDNFVKFMIARHTVLDAMPRRHKTGMDYLDARSIYDKFKSNQLWVEAAQEITDFNNSLLDMVAETGLVTLDEAQRMKNAWEHYIPLVRVRDETKRFKQVSLGLGEKPVKGRVKGGSELMVIDPVQTTVQRAIMMYERAATHLAKKHIIAASRSVHATGGDKETESIGRWVEEVPANIVPTKFTLGEIVGQLKSEFGLTKEDIGIADSMDPADQMAMLQTTMTIWRKDYYNHNDKPIVRVTDRGNTKLYYLDPELDSALEGIHVSQAESLAQMIFGKFTRLHKLGATGLNMSFAVTNIAADFGTWLFQRKEVDNSSVISPFEMMGVYIMSEIKKARGEKGDATVELWQKLGGELSTYLGMDRDQIRNFVDDVIGTPAHAKPLHAMHKFTDTMRSVIGVSEVGPRLAEFRGVLERHGYTKERLEAGDMPPRHIQIEAVNAAHDVTTNFKRMGIRGEVLNQYIPYINANIQSKDKFYRMIRENPKRAFFRIAVAATAHLAMYMAFVSDEDWYDEAQPWLKYGFWTFSVDGKPVIRVKRPYEWGYVATAVPEMIINAYSQRSGVPIQEGLKQGANMFLLPVKPSGITPMVETAFNYDLFREAPIDNATLMRLEPHRRFGNSTTLLSRAIAESPVGRAMDVSPNRLDHLLSGLSGGAYKNYVNIAESAFGFKEFEAGDFPGMPEPVSNIANAGVQLAFRQKVLRKDYTKSPSEFYEEYFSLERKINTYKETGVDAPETERKRYGYLKDYADLMSAIRTAREQAGMTTRDGRHKYDKFITGLAREALGKDRLERYPSPFNEQNLPADVEKAVDQFLGRKVWSLTQPRVGDRRKGEAIDRYNSRKTIREFEIDRAIETLTRISADPKKLQESLRKKIASQETWLERSKRLSNRLSQ